MHNNLPNFGEASTTLYHGGQPSKTGFHMLAKMGVNIVVDLRGNRDDERKIVTHDPSRHAVRSNTVAMLISQR
jgi:hypothetical protein